LRGLRGRNQHFPSLGWFSGCYPVAAHAVQGIRLRQVRFDIRNRHQRTALIAKLKLRERDSPLQLGKFGIWNTLLPKSADPCLPLDLSLLIRLDQFADFLQCAASGGDVTRLHLGIGKRVQGTGFDVILQNFTCASVMFLVVSRT
jgi:hypothetical protein